MYQNVPVTVLVIETCDSRWEIKKIVKIVAEFEKPLTLEIISMLLFHLERERDRFRWRRCFRFRSRSRDLLRLRSIRRRAGRSLVALLEALFVRSPADAFLEGDLERERDL